MGIAYREIGKHKKAIGKHEEAKVDFDNAITYFDEVIKGFKNAEEAFDKAEKDCNKAKFRISFFAFSKKDIKKVEDFKKAKEAFEKAKGSSNQKILADACANKSICLLMQKKKHDAQKIFKDAIKLDEKVSLNILNNEALCSVTKEDYTKAHKKFDEAKNFYSSNYEAWYWKGLIYYYKDLYATWAFKRATNIHKKIYKDFEQNTKNCGKLMDDFEQNEIMRKKVICSNMYYRKGVSIDWLFKYKRSFKVIDYVHQWKSPRMVFYIICQNLLNFCSKHIKSFYRFFETR
jgi:tetratricopeptide (TPR) repeat protein